MDCLSSWYPQQQKGVMKYEEELEDIAELKINIDKW